METQVEETQQRLGKFQGEYERAVAAANSVRRQQLGRVIAVILLSVILVPSCLALWLGSPPPWLYALSLATVMITGLFWLVTLHSYVSARELIELVDTRVHLAGRLACEKGDQLSGVVSGQHKVMVDQLKRLVERTSGTVPSVATVGEIGSPPPLEGLGTIVNDNTEERGPGL
jgi:hypothetical protein